MVAPDLSTSPAVNPPIRFETYGDDGRVANTDPFAFDPLQGELFPDGSGLHPRIPLLRRAGWAVAQLNVTVDPPRLRRLCFGELPDFYTQDSYNSEHYAMAQAAFRSSAPNILHPDCLSVVLGWQGGPAVACRPSSRGAGLWRQAFHF